MNLAEQLNFEMILLQVLLADSTKNIGEINKDYIEFTILLLKILLKAHGKNHVNSPTTFVEAILWLWQQAKLPMSDQMI